MRNDKRTYYCTTKILKAFNLLNGNFVAPIYTNNTVQGS